MNRTLFYKIIYTLLIAAMSGTAVLLLINSKDKIVMLILLGAVLLLPGRICGHFWREFFRGRHLLTQGYHPEAQMYFERFLVKVKKEPWLKRLIILSWGIYTRDIEVMTLNNLAAIQIERGNFTAAREWIEQALKLDAECPLLYYNLAIIAAASAEMIKAEELFMQATQKGYSNSSIDQMIRHAGELLARIEGRVQS